MAFFCPLHNWHDQDYFCPLCITTATTIGIMPEIEYQPESEMSDKDLIVKLKNECRRVKLQRNGYEEKLRLANREIIRLSAELKLLEKYINKL